MWIDQQSVSQLIMHMNNTENCRDCARDKVVHQGACEMTTPKSGAATSSICTVARCTHHRDHCRSARLLKLDYWFANMSAQGTWATLYKVGIRGVSLPQQSPRLANFAVERLQHMIAHPDYMQSSDSWLALRST